jgi:magnesium chelatase accessory protein
MPLDTVPAWWPHQAASRLDTLAGLRWHALDLAPPQASATVLLLHGTGASAHSWRHLAPLLATVGTRVLAPDLPGHGFTLTPRHQDLSLPGVAAAVRAWLHALQARPTMVIGHSAGAAVAVQMALGGALRVPIVSLNGALLPLQSGVGRWFTPAARLLAANPLVAPGFAAWAAWPAATRRLLAGTGSRIDALGERCYRHLVSDARHAGGALRLMAAWDLEALQQQLPTLTTPLCLMVGLNDRMLPPSHAARVQALLPAAHRIDLPGLGHLAHEEDAACVMRHLQGECPFWRTQLTAAKAPATPGSAAPAGGPPGLMPGAVPAGA